MPLGWFPRLAKGTPTERANYRLIGGGEGIHWPSLVAGRKSGERPEHLCKREPLPIE
jgi:hypothetical protein